MGQLLGGKGDILVMEGIPCPINTDRVEAFREVLAEKYPEIKILESQPAWWNTEKGMSLMENYLQKYPEIDGIKTTGFEILADGWRNWALLNPVQNLLGAGNDGAIFVDQDTFETSFFQISDDAYDFYKKLMKNIIAV